MQDRAEARRFKVAAMYRTINEFTAAGVLSDRGRVLLSALVEATHPDKVRRWAGPEGRQHAVLRVEVSKGRMAKVAGWSPIDEGGMADADIEAKAKLAAGVRKVGRVLDELAEAGLVSRQRIAGGRSITIVELIGMPAAGGTPEPAAAPVEAGGTPVTGGTLPGGTSESAGGTSVSQPVGHPCPNRWDKYVPPLSSAFPLEHSPSALRAAVEPHKGPTSGAAVGAEQPAAEAEAIEPAAKADEYHDERVAILQAAGVTGSTLAELAGRRLLPKSVSAVVAKAKRGRRVANPAGLVVALVRDLDDDWAEGQAPPRRPSPKPPAPADAAVLQHKFRALWSRVADTHRLVDTGRGSIEDAFNVEALKAGLVEAFLAEHPWFKNSTDKPTTDRPEFWSWFVAGVEADRDWLDIVAWVFDVRHELFDRRDRLACEDPEDDWNRIQFVIEQAEAAGALKAGPDGEKWGNALSRAENDPQFVRWCMYNVEALADAMRTFKPPAALVPAARIDPNAMPMFTRPAVLNLLVAGVEAWLVKGVPEHQREAFGRIAAAEWALLHDGTEPAANDPKYMRFVVNHAGTIREGFKDARQRLDGFIIVAIEAAVPGAEWHPRAVKALAGTDDIMAAWCRSGWLKPEHNDGCVDLVQETKAAEAGAAERGKAIVASIDIEAWLAKAKADHEAWLAEAKAASKNPK